jgi:hypothetical protein
MQSTLILLLILLTPALGFAQTTFVGGCDQYQPGIGGDYCMNTGSATMYQPFTGDIKCVRGTPQCSPTNTSQCGKCTVVGLMGIPFNGTLADGQTWCYHAADNTMIPCNP